MHEAVNKVNRKLKILFIEEGEDAEEKFDFGLRVRDVEDCLFRKVENSALTTFNQIVVFSRHCPRHQMKNNEEICMHRRCVGELSFDYRRTFKKPSAELCECGSLGKLPA